MMLNKNMKRIVLIGLLIIIVGHEPLRLAIENILSGGVEWKTQKQEDVAKYGEKIIRQFFSDYKSLPVNALEQKYRINLSRYPLINKGYSGYQLSLLNWTAEESGMPLLEINYEVRVLSVCNKTKYKFTLFYYETYTIKKMENPENWRIRWELHDQTP